MSRSMISKEKLMNVVTIAASGTAYSNARRFHDCDGTACLLIVSTAGSITVTQQCSNDKVTWYDPETNSAAVGAVEDGVTVTTGRYLSYTPVLCDWIRFKVVATSAAETNVSLTLVYRVEL